MKRLYYDLRWRIELRWHQLRRWWHMRRLKPGQCEHPGCHNEGEPCYLPNYDEDEIGEPSCFYCDKHMAAEGFCRGCGQFWGGVESFEFYYAHGGYEGFCENCSDQIRREIDEDDDNDSPYDDGYDDDDYDQYANDEYGQVLQGGEA